MVRKSGRLAEYVYPKHRRIEYFGDAPTVPAAVQNVIDIRLNVPDIRTRHGRDAGNHHGIDGRHIEHEPSAE
jgi:hypothetical protein